MLGARPAARRRLSLLGSRSGAGPAACSASRGWGPRWTRRSCGGRCAATSSPPCATSSSTWRCCGSVSARHRAGPGRAGPGLAAGGLRAAAGPGGQGPRRAEQRRRGGGRELGGGGAARLGRRGALQLGGRLGDAPSVFSFQLLSS